MNDHGSLSDETSSVVGTEFLSALYAATKALQIYPDENQVVRDAVSQLERLATELIKAEGGLAVWLAGNYIFVNDLRVRVDLTDYATLAALRELLRGHGVGRVTVSSDVTRRDWLGFLGLVGAPTTPGSAALEAFEERLAESGITMIKVAPPAPLFNPQGEAAAIEAARRTYASSVKAARDMMNTMVMGKAIGAQRAERAILGLVDQVQPVATSSTSGLARRERRRYWRALASEVAVTVQEFSTTTSAWADLTRVKPASRNCRAKTWLSAWFNLQPWVWMATVGPSPSPSRLPFTGFSLTAATKSIRFILTAVHLFQFVGFFRSICGRGR